MAYILIALVIISFIAAYLKASWTYHDIMSILEGMENDEISRYKNND